MLTASQAAKIKRLCAAVAKAEIDYSWRGVQLPEDLKSIDSAKKKAHKALDAYLRKVSKLPGAPEQAGKDHEQLNNYI